jgi:hypothetical protein
VRNENKKRKTGRNANAEKGKQTKRGKRMTENANRSRIESIGRKNSEKKDKE